MKKSINKSKIFMIIGICTLCITIIGGTVAYYNKALFNDLAVDTITQGLDFFINYAKGEDIIGVELTPSEDYTKGLNTTIELYKKDDTYDIYGHIYLDVNAIGTNLSNTSALKYTVVNNDTIISEGTLKGSAKNDSVLIKANIPLETTSQTYTVYVWLDSSENPSMEIEGESLSLTVRCEATMKPIVAGKITEYIKTLYLSNIDGTVTNNSIVYNYATSVSLMNDRLGGKTEDYNAGNIRYYGAEPNNYIYFNCDDYTDTSTCETWRIIGVFDGKVKIMRSSQIGSYSWDSNYDSNGSRTYDNNWTDATLNTLLNDSYYNNKDEVTYYNNSSTATTVNFATDGIGIKNDTTREMIAEVSWNLGGWNSSSVYANQIYGYERGTTVYSTSMPTSWTGKIALAYPSDYGYAADFNTCSGYTLFNYENSNCTSVNWMYNVITYTGSSYTIAWLLTPRSGSSYGAWFVYSSGYVVNDYNVSYAFGVAPVLYLDSELAVESGTGASDDPYRISVS